MARLEEKGVIFARLEDLEGVESYSAVYNGEILVQGGSAADLRKSLNGAWAKTGDDLVKELDEILEAGHDINLSFFENADIIIQKEKPIGKLYGQSTDFTCASTSLRMHLDDLNKSYSEIYIAQALGTVMKGPNRGASILDIPDALYNIRLEHILTEIKDKI